MTHAITGLAFVDVEATDLDAWEKLGTSVLGAQAVRIDADTLRLRLDERLSRFVIRRGATNAIRSFGWDVASREHWDEVLAALTKFGTEFDVLSPAESDERGAIAIATMTDPSGSPLQLVLGPYVEPVNRFVSPTGARFVTGDQGMGHLTLVAKNYDETVRFYTEALGFHVRDSIDSGIRATFAGCNPRHHSIAIVDGGSKTFIDHLMLEVDDIDIVGRALDQVNRGGAPLTQNLGRHWNDLMVSFYFQSPAGVQIEYGCWARRVDEASWTEVRQGGVGGASIWGHKPTELAPDYASLLDS